MLKSFRILGILVVVGLLVGAGVTAAQDKPAGGQDKKENASAADPLTGDWDGSAETPNGTVGSWLVTGNSKGVKKSPVDAVKATVTVG